MSGAVAEMRLVRDLATGGDREDGTEDYYSVNVVQREGAFGAHWP